MKASTTLMLVGTVASLIGIATLWHYTSFGVVGGVCLMLYGENIHAEYRQMKKEGF